MFQYLYVVQENPIITCNVGSVNDNIQMKYTLYWLFYEILPIPIIIWGLIRTGIRIWSDIWISMVFEKKFMRNSVFCFSYSKSWINSVFFLVIQKIIRGFVLGFFCTGTCNGQAILTHHQVMLISFSVLLWSFFPKISSCNHHQQYWKYLERYRKYSANHIFDRP